MAKRRATTELNRDNWDKEDEKEDPGTFKRLNEDELKNRVIRKAKRFGNLKETSGVSPFAAFSGFSKSGSCGNPFNFLKTDVHEGDSNSDNISKMEVTKEKNGGTADEEKTNELKTEAKQMTDSTAEKRKPIRSIEYYRQLQSLNESIMKWMQLHLSKNSCCDFTPVFNDYKKHLDTLNVTYPVKNESTKVKLIHSSIPASFSSEEDSQPKNEKKNANYGFTFGSNLKTEDETDYGANFKSNTTNTSSVAFGMAKTPTGTSSMSTGPTTSFREEVLEKKPFQFSSGSSTKEESTSDKKPFQFSFGLNSNTQLGNSHDSNVSKPFTFAASSAEKTTESESADAEDPEYVPPKNDFNAVKEEDAFYSKRCKLFFQKNKTFVERGIGMLHLKPLDGKTQLLIRADTNLGNIMLNIILSESLPVSRTGKNNVLLVCVPNPPIDPKKADADEAIPEAIPMLIRVKTSEDADQLLETLNKNKS